MASNITSRIVGLDYEIQYIESDQQSVTQAIERQAIELRDMGAAAATFISIEQAESCHQQINSVVQRVLTQITEMGRDISSQTTHSNQEQMFSLVEQATGLEARVSAAQTRLNNTILTHFPTAEIDYGAPLIGPIIQLGSSAQRNFSGNSNTISTQLTSIREIRGDGNCFLSSMATRLLESLVQESICFRFKIFVTESVIQVPNHVKEKILFTFATLSTHPSGLERTLQDNHQILPLISFFRHLAAHEMLSENRELYEPAFRSDVQDIFHGDATRPYEELINEYVLKMGVDCAQPLMTALCKMLAFQVNILDRRMGASEGRNILDQGEPRAHFIRQDAHYFVAYPNATSTSSVHAPLVIEEVQTPTVTMTEIAVKFDAGFRNNLFVRGNLPGMSWERGAALRNRGGDNWVFEIPSNARNCEFKLVLNDTKFEQGFNRRINSEGQVLDGRGQAQSPIVPRFSR